MRHLGGSLYVPDDDDNLAEQMAWYGDKCGVILIAEINAWLNSAEGIVTLREVRQRLNSESSKP